MKQVNQAHFVRGEGIPGNKLWIRMGEIQLIIEVIDEFPEYSEGIRTTLVMKNGDRVFLSTEYNEFCRRLFS